MRLCDTTIEVSQGGAQHDHQPEGVGEAHSVICQGTEEARVNGVSMGKLPRLIFSDRAMDRMVELGFEIGRRIWGNPLPSH